MNVVIYIHGKDGSAPESEHYKPLFPDCEVMGLDYKTFTPWDTGKESRIAVEDLKARYENIILIANSIGAYFSMNAGINKLIQKAYFISPIVDLEKLNGYELSPEYLHYVRSHPIVWDVPTEILYGSNDNLTSFETMKDFAEKHHAGLTVMENGEHWFHTDEQMQFLDNWIRKTNKHIELDKYGKDAELLAEIGSPMIPEDMYARIASGEVETK